MGSSDSSENHLGRRKMSAIYEVLRQLDEWRHLPDYQLERRVDIFFGMFLPKLIEKRFGVCVDKVVPEFPLHKGLFKDKPSFESGSHHSVKVDFAVFGTKVDKKQKQIFLVELKTDMESLDFVQLENMIKACRAGPTCIMRGVQQLARNTRAMHKYAHLVWRLIELGYLDSRDCTKFTSMRLEKNRPGLTGAFKDLCVDDKWSDDCCVTLVVVLPNYSEPHDPEHRELICQFNQVTFPDFAKAVEGSDELFEAGFADVFGLYLRAWAGVEAGKYTPWFLRREKSCSPTNIDTS